MITAFLLSVGQLGDRRVLAVLAKSLALTIALLAMLGGALALAARWITLGWFGAGEGLGTLAAAAALVGAVLLGWLLFRAVAIAVVGIFADDVGEAVEAKHYPQALASARAVPFTRSAAMGLRSAGRAIGVNLLLSPIYILLLATGIGTAALFFAVNSWLLGRDLDDMVAVRHLPRDALVARRGATRGARLLLGVAGTALLTIPLVNLLAPVLGAAMATHNFHRSRR